MEKIKNNNNQNDSSFESGDIKRCLICNKIPLFELIERNNEYFIKYKCENNHKGEVSLEEYLKNDKYGLNKLNCDECNKNQENNFYKFHYCINCQKVLCHNCLINHLEKEHQYTPLSRYDSTCLEHNQYYCSYCYDCEKNICVLCLNQHQNHQIISLFPLKFNENILNMKNKELNEIKKIKNEIIEGLKNEIKVIEDVYLNYEKKMNIKSSFINNLIDTYNFEKKLNNYNYEIIENLKKIEKIKFKFPDFSDCQNIFDKSQTFISFYKEKTEETNENINVLKYEIYKTLNYHKDSVNQIILLKDGRIASSSNDESILIYDKEMNDIQISIDNLESNVLNIMESNEGYIFASLYSGSILIFKLNSLKSYQLIQNIKGHKNCVKKIIQIKDGRFISCSSDKTIKIWKFLNEQLTLDHTLNEESGISSIIELKENEIISTLSGEGSIVFWNINELTIIKKINQIYCSYGWNNIQRINEDKIIVGGIEYLYLIKNYHLINKINSKCYSICNLSNGYILTGHKNGKIKEWKLINNELIFIGKKKVHDDEIRVIYEIINNFMVSGSCDKTINIYKIE